MNQNNLLSVPDEIILSKIHIIRGIKVMLDMDLAELYGVETKQLKRAVRRNFSRFPLDFMFELTSDELTNWRSQFGTSNREKMGLRIPPTEILRKLEQIQTKDLRVFVYYLPNSVTNFLKVMFVSVLSCGIIAYFHAFSFLALFISVAFLQ